MQKLQRKLSNALRRSWWSLCGLLVFIGLWQVGHEVYGTMILPSPGESVQALWGLYVRGEALPAVLLTAQRALCGFVVAGVAGSLLGIAAGLSPRTAQAVKPVVTVLLGVPAIAWIVLALLWFGSGGLTPVFTVVVTTLPITFAGAVEGARTLDKDLQDMARSFGTPLPMMLWDVHLPHILSYLFPEWVTALGMSWKAAVMAELLASTDGIGAGMAMARVNLETSEAMAWIIAVLCVMLAVEHLLLEPLKRRMEPWRATRRKQAGWGA